jgi:tetratricopeptide (TPR) repeat protein
LYFDAFIIKFQSLNPNYADALYNKGVSLYYLARYEEGMTIFGRALKIDSNNAGLWYNRACSKIKKGDTENG